MSEPKTKILAYLELTTGAQGLATLPHMTPDEYVLANGRPFASQPLTPAETTYLSAVDWQIYLPMQCYRNAQHLLLSLPPTEEMTLSYNEGYFTTGAPYGIIHAWLSLNGKVIDPTARKNPGQTPITGEFPLEWEYLGIELDPSRWPHNVDHGPGGVLDDWECGWPMLAAVAPASR